MKFRILSLVLALCLMVAVGGGVFAVSVSSFTDVKESHWAYSYIDNVSDKGLMTGTSDTTVEPDIGTSRAMFVVVLARMEGVQVNNSAATPFNDVISGEWYAGAVAWAADNKIVLGTSATTFEPHSLITREQMATLIARYVTFVDIDLPSINEEVTFADHASISDYAKDAVKTCQIADVMTRVYNNFEPQSSALRAQVATIYSRLIDIVGNYAPAPTVNDMLTMTAEEFQENYQESADITYDGTEATFDFYQGNTYVANPGYYAGKPRLQRAGAG